MKKLADLVSTDFPSVDPAHFEEWKQASTVGRRRGWLALPLMLGAMVAVFFLVEGFIAAVAIIAITMVFGLIVGSPANQAAKQAGITRADIRRALRGPRTS